MALCQVNLTVGDLDGNVEVMARALKEAEAADAHVACFPELGAAGYPPEDLVLKRGFVRADKQLRPEEVVIMRFRGRKD